MNTNAFPLSRYNTLLQLPAGQHICQGGELSGCAWQLLDGTVRLDQNDSHRERFVQVVLTGELFGAEAWLGQPQSCSARTLTDCTLVRLPTPDEPLLSHWLGRALQQQIARAADMVALRTGSAPERVRRLLLMLAPPGAHGGQDGPADHVLPRIKDIAAIVDTAPETVSRVISSLRRSQVLNGRHARFARFDPDQLAHCTLPAGMTRSDVIGTHFRQPAAVAAS